MKPLNRKRRLEALRAPSPKGSNPIARTMIVQSKGGHHGDARKAASRNACRGRAAQEE